MAAAAAAQRVQLIKGERHLFSSSDDSAMMKQILATHAPDGRDLDVRPLLHIVEDVLQRSTPTVLGAQPVTQLEAADDKMHHAEEAGMLEALAYIIHKISCEISCKCSGSGDAHSTTLHMFNVLSSYGWEAKVVLALAGFSVGYGEFWLTAQLHTVNPLAKSVAQLKQLPDILEHSDALKPRFDAVINLIRSMLQVTKCIIEFKLLPTEYISQDDPDMMMAMAHIPTAVYWIIRGIIACSAQIIGLIGLGHEYLLLPQRHGSFRVYPTNSVALTITSISNSLGAMTTLVRIIICIKYWNAEGKRHHEAYEKLIHLFEIPHLDNMKIIRALINTKDDLPLFDGHTKSRVSVEVLKKKFVMLYITDINIAQEELFTLIQIYSDTHEGKLDRHYEIVWLPLVDRHLPWTSEKQAQFDRIASMMPWFTLHQPSKLESAVTLFIRDRWKFDKRPLLVVLDAQGRVACPNALHMIWIWGSLAFPFTSEKEEALWKDETWRIEFLVDEIDPNILAWVKEGRHVCLYGGEDIEWIRRFTTTMRRVSQEARVPLEMIYVGKSNPRERVKKVVATIANEKLSGYWQDPVMIWFFWVRLESMWHSKRQHGKTIENDMIMQEVMTMLSFDGSDEGWAVISRGSLEIVKANGKKIVDCLMQFDTWKADVESEGFVPALRNALAPYQTDEHCTRLILPGDSAKIKEQVICAECKKPMEKFVLYRCCND